MNLNILSNGERIGESMEEKRPGPLYPMMIDYIQKYWKEELYLSDDLSYDREGVIKAVREDLNTYMVIEEPELIAGSLKIIMRAYPDTIPGILEILADKVDNEKIMWIVDSVVGELRDILHISADPEDFDPRDPRIFVCLMGELLEKTTKSLERLIQEYLSYIEIEIFAGEDSVYPPYWWDTTLYEISKRLIFILENSENIAEILHIYGYYEELIDIFYRYDYRLTSLMEVNGNIAPALLRFLDKTSWSADMDEIFTKLGAIFLESEVKREFLRMFVRKMSFPSDELFWKSLYLLMELLDDKEQGVASKSSHLILHHLKKEVEKGIKPEIFTGIIGDHAPKILKNLATKYYTISDEDALLLFEMSLDKGKFLAVLVSYLQEPMWARVILRLLAERRMAMEDLKKYLSSGWKSKKPIGEAIYQAIKKDENPDYWAKIYMDFFKDRDYVILE